MLLGGNKERRAHIYNKIREKTGLNSEFLIWYKTFNEEASLSDGIVMFGDVKYKMQEFMLLVDGKTKEHWGEYTNVINDVYEFALKEFEKRGLVKYHITESGHTYPKITGYNYMNDPEFFIAYRKKGEINWTGRISTPADLSDIVRHVNCGYEFREKDIANRFFN